MTLQEDLVASDAETDEQFRLRLREFLTTHHPGKAPRDPAEKLAWQKAWAATMYDAGFAGPSWPGEYGGMNLSFERQVIYQEEVAKAHLPAIPGTGIGIAAPTIIKYGTPEQKERFLGPMLRADKIWAQGYSEPEAGSDLQALRTAARLDGDEYVVSGQKVWTSFGDCADILFTLVRTGSQESRQNGITYLLIDMHSPGVLARPLRDLTGAAHFSEVFLDEVRVPVANRIGEHDGGWPLVRTSLGHERAAGAMNQASMYRRVLDELIQLARERGANANPGIRARLADFEMRVRLMRYSAMRTIADILANGEPGPASSVSRLFNTAFEQDLHEFAMEMLGSYGLLGKDPDAVQRGRWVYGFLRTRASTIGAGTSEIQLNTVAEQVLKLPRDPAMPPR
ncbi:MAG TPA: acyl-CoA dehydrogenase family protein [Frankiaceae bacterium]|jgi:alkylation response protein AidB-like acyl-CoA dehydrogenase|nr:acyl-CoA dehydrogenase family protein [Frankiaceae bacterium]